MDDELTILEMMDRLLTKAGYRVETADSGLEALQRIARGHAYDVILLDISMPFKEGRAVYEEIIRLRPEFARRVIFVTGNPSALDPQVLERTGASFLAKPFSVDELIHTIQRVLGRLQR